MVHNISLSRCSITSSYNRSTFRLPKLQAHYEIQNQSTFVMVQLRLEQDIIVIDRALDAKATQIA